MRVLVCALMPPLTLLKNMVFASSVFGGFPIDDRACEEVQIAQMFPFFKDRFFGFYKPKFAG